jgi:segregation and condensation protein B
MNEAEPLPLHAVFEAFLFVADDPLRLDRVHHILSESTDRQTIEQEFERFMEEWNNRNAGTVIVRVAGGYQFRTNPSLEPWIRKLKTRFRTVKFSRAALETLAIIAYKQPISTPEIDQIRGIATGSVIKTLMEKGMLTILGRKEAPGRPIQYGTSSRFLEEFGLNELGNLPSLKELETFFQARGEPRPPEKTEDTPNPPQP